MTAPVHGFSKLAFARLAPEEQLQRAQALLELMQQRRTVREFSDEPVPFALIEMAIKAAATAPSGANQQPWSFVVIGNAELKRAIREAAEKEEYENYHGRFPDTWLKELERFGTDWHKPFLETAPWLIVVFKQDYGLVIEPDGKEHKLKHYYANESVGIATGILLTALHNAGLATLTHTPNPMGFLSKLLQRPKNEKPFLLIPVGYPAADAQVPNIRKKTLDETMTVIA